MPGVLTLLTIMLIHVNNRKLSLNKLCKLISTNPAKLYKAKNKGQIKLNYDADITIVDLKKSQTITNKQMATKSGWTPYDGKKVTGWPIMTIVNGSLVMKNGKVEIIANGGSLFLMRSQPPLTFSCTQIKEIGSRHHMCPFLPAASA